jgi:hypothetical protein
MRRGRMSRDRRKSLMGTKRRGGEQRLFWDRINKTSGLDRIVVGDGNLG